MASIARQAGPEAHSRLFAALLASALLHAGLVFFPAPPTPALASTPTRDLELTSTMRVRLAPLAKSPSGPMPSQARLRREVPVASASRAAKGGLSPHFLPSAKTPPSSPSLGPSAPRAAPPADLQRPEGPERASERSFANDVQWPDFSPMGPGNFSVDISFDDGGRPIEIAILSSSFSSEEEGALLALLREAIAPKAGKAMLEFTIEPSREEID